MHQLGPVSFASSGSWHHQLLDKWTCSRWCFLLTCPIGQSWNHGTHAKDMCCRMMIVSNCHCCCCQVKQTAVTMHTWNGRQSATSTRGKHARKRHASVCIQLWWGTRSRWFCVNDFPFIFLGEKGLFFLMKRRSQNDKTRISVHYHYLLRTIPYVTFFFFL